MMTDYKRIAISLLDGQSRRRIAAACGTSSKTITKVKKYLEENSITKEDIEKSDNEKLKENISPQKEYKTTKEKPDYDAAHIALMDGNSLKSLWDKYNARCKASNIEGISYTRYYELVTENEHHLRATEDPDLKAGELVIVKWLNRSLATADADGVAGKAYVLLIYFPLCQYICLYGSLDKTAETTERIIADCFEKIGACPKMMMTDNVRAFYSNDGEWRQQLTHLSNHFGIRVVPAETISPQVLSEFTSLKKAIDKTVREHIYRSISEIDEYLREIQQIYVSECIYKTYTRERLFKDEVRCMNPVPQDRYSPCREVVMTIQFNMHISVDGTYYSVPYTAYLKDRSVTVRVCAGSIEIYQENELIAWHRKSSNRYCTNRSHMPPPAVQETLPWNGWRLRKWALRIGRQTYRVVDGIIRCHEIEQQAYATCISILKLGDKYRRSLEAACSTVDDRNVAYAYKIIKEYIFSKK